MFSFNYMEIPALLKAFIVLLLNILVYGLELLPGGEKQLMYSVLPKDTNVTTAIETHNLMAWPLEFEFIALSTLPEPDWPRHNNLILRPWI